MRWFKHLTDASDDESIVALEGQFGLIGYARWWKLLETIGRQMKKNDRPSVTYTWSKWESILVGKRKLLVTYLLASANLGLMEMEANGDLVTVSVPKLLKYRDEYLRKSGQAPERTPDKVAPDTELDTETDVEPKKTSSSRRRSRADKQSFSETSRELKAAKYLFAKIRTNNPKSKEPNLQSWAAEFDLIFRVDKRDAADVRTAIDFSQSDSFWLRTCLSPKNLRKHFERLLLKQSHSPPALKSSSPAIASAPMTDE